MTQHLYTPLGIINNFMECYRKCRCPLCLVTYHSHGFLFLSASLLYPLHADLRRGAEVHFRRGRNGIEITPTNFSHSLHLHIIAVELNAQLPMLTHQLGQGAVSVLS